MPRTLPIRTASAEGITVRYRELTVGDIQDALTLSADEAALALMRVFTQKIETAECEGEPIDPSEITMLELRAVIESVLSESSQGG